MKTFGQRGILFFLLLYSLTSFGQTRYELASASEMKIDGSSTVSEWSVAIGDLQGSFTLVDGFEKAEGTVMMEDIALQFPVEKMDGGRGPIMNGKIKTAFKSEEHPEVIFTASTGKITALAEGILTVEAVGAIKLAGVEKELTVMIEVSEESDGQAFIFSGNKDLTMSMFSIEKPSAFFGQLQTHDDLNIKYNLKLVQQPK